MPAAQRFYLSDDIPEIFKQADRMLDEQDPPDEIVRKPYIPFDPPGPNRNRIKGNPAVYGPIRITRKWYETEKKKQALEKAVTRKQLENQVIKLLARRDMLRKQLNGLNPGKSRDSKRIAAINIELRDISELLDQYKNLHGIDICKVDVGSKLGRFIVSIKRRAKKTWKTVKKFTRNHIDAIISLATFVVPVTLFVLGKLFMPAAVATSAIANAATTALRL